MDNFKEAVGEVIGTFFLVLFGCGSVAVSVCFNEYHGVFQVGIVWGIGLTLTIYATRHFCNAHFNPAVTIAMAVCKRLPWRKVPGYLTAQFAGAFLGGMAIYGGVIGGLIAGFVVCKVKKIRFLRAFDTIAPGLVLAQAIGRWGNFFNREAFGEYTDSLFAMQIKYDEVGGVITDLMRENMVTVDGVQYIQVAPTFLYESAICLLIFILIMIFRRFQQYNGEVSLWYLGSYALARSWIEGMRTDSLMLWNTDIAVSQLLSVAVFAGAFVLLVINRIRLARKSWTPDFELVLSPGAVGTVEYNQKRLAEKKAARKKGSSWETYMVETKEEEKGSEPPSAEDQPSEPEHEEEMQESGEEKEEEV